jgi:hypothetical protein
MNTSTKLALTILATATLGACQPYNTTPPATQDPGRAAAQDIKQAAEATKTNAEVINLKTPVTKVVISNTTGNTSITHGTSVAEASLNIEKIKTSDICEFKQEQNGSTLHVSVRNRGFTGKGDCEINLQVSIPAASDVSVVTTTGSVAFNLPKDSKPQVKFDTKSGQMTSDFENNNKGEPRITVRTQSGNLSIKAL